MAQRLHLYMNNPTTGSTDGTEISSDTNVLPLNIVLDATQNEEKAVKCAVRCDSGYEVEGDVTVYLEGTNADKWSLAPDDNYEDSDTAVLDNLFASAIILTDVGSTNKVFWVKAASSSSASPQNDRSVKIVAEGLVVVSE